MRKNGVEAVLKEAQEILIVVGCPCHLINLAAKKGAACLAAKLDEVLVDIYYLENSAKRKDRISRDARHRGAEYFETPPIAVATAGKVSDQIAGAVAALGQLLFE
ncbi:hypothetical protein HPB50_012102 [Hyalomma asiaticum]|uniref:Uncharacterized protein n=1 Tax=Hyalomma asiaticum TaxID=266040 RepID=A0ACB7S383_HYAAI|nr:hypothetical protein HPB50_012102 [Hyalomma asiaticum]